MCRSHLTLASPVLKLKLRAQLANRAPPPSVPAMSSTGSVSSSGSDELCKDGSDDDEDDKRYKQQQSGRKRRLPQGEAKQVLDSLEVSGLFTFTSDCLCSCLVRGPYSSSCPTGCMRLTDAVIL